MLITTVKNQSLIDLAVQYYGNVDATLTILDDNQHLGADNEFDLGYAVVAGTQVLIRDTDPIINVKVIETLGGEAIATVN